MANRPTAAAMSAAHSPEARAKAAKTRRKNFLAKKKQEAANEEIIPIHAIPPKPSPKSGQLIRSHKRTAYSDGDPRTQLAMAVVTLVAHIIGP